MSCCEVAINSHIVQLRIFEGSIVPKRQQLGGRGIKASRHSIIFMSISCRHWQRGCGGYPVIIRIKRIEDSGDGAS